jgi:Schitoviridae DNA primase
MVHYNWIKGAPMKSYDEMEFHPTAEQLVEILCNKTQNRNPLFFRVLVAYYFSLVASMMRCKIASAGQKELPVNLYAINLGTSGSGKGHSTNVIEESVIDQFQQNFTENTFPLLASQNIPKISHRRAVRCQTDPDEELLRAEKEFGSLGPLVFSFDSGTTAAVKQARHKLLMASAGSMNLQIDEIGSNLMGNMEVLNTFLELYDVGRIKQKLVKNTNDNIRHEEINGRTPTNMLLFGTPSRLLNGGKVEDEFYSMLDTGYARRCFFGYAKGHTRTQGLTPVEILAQRTNTNTEQFLEDLSDRLGALADMSLVAKTLQVTKEVSLLFIEYEQRCIAEAEKLGEHDEMRKAEMSHRYFKALKLAGAYAFIDGSPEITEDLAYNAIKLAEQSGQAFDQLLTRDRPYVKLAKYIAGINRPVTQADLVEDLPFYKGSLQQKSEMLQLAIAHGYQNNIIIKKAFDDGIEFLRGETLEVTDLDKMLVSYSGDIATGYRGDQAPFAELTKLTQAKGLHWCTHQFKNEHRTEDNAEPGFNMVVLDIDHGVNFSTAKLLLKDYKALFYTTKRHTPDDNRFRVILPTNYVLKLDAKDYKEFMHNLFNWLPFEVDEATGQRARKWLSHNGHSEYQDGELLDVLPFIPKTSKNDDFKQRVLDQRGMDNLERWVMNNSGDGNRNNMLLRYALVLVDGGFDFENIRQRVTSLNSKMTDSLDEAEILSTVMVSVGKALAKK